MKTVTFHGAEYRVQLGTLDLLDDPVKFFVYAIPAHYHKSTAFRSRVGTQLYYGDSFAVAWSLVRRIAPQATPPKWAPPLNQEHTSGAV